jgi:hypothetical protein
MVKLIPQENVSGDAARAKQGFGRVSERQPPIFRPEEVEAAYAHFADAGFVVVGECLTAAELAHLNGFCDRTQAERPDLWGLGERRRPHHRNQGLMLSQPLLDYPELDPYTRHTSTFPLVARILGGEERVASASSTSGRLRRMPAPAP